MAFSDTISFDSGMAALDKFKALQVRRASAIPDKLPVSSTALPGTGFKNPPPLALLFKPFQFLKCLDLSPVGLGLDCVPFHSGWELVEWRPKLHVLEFDYFEILEICEKIEQEEHLEVFGPQIEIDLGNPTDVGEPPVEVAGVAPTVVVEVEEESFVEVLEARASVEKEMGDQDVRIGDEPVIESVEKEMGE